MLTIKKKIQFKDSTPSVSIDVPENCPHCGKSMSPRIYTAVSNQYAEDKYGTVGFPMFCILCEKFFIRMYSFTALTTDYGKIKGYRLQEENLTYTPPVSINIPENVIEFSPRFYDTYKESLTAKQNGLNQIYGMGLRKSLEILIKDFAIYLSPDKESAIINDSLGKVINSHFADFADIMALFKASAWIGNDETHYKRIHPDKDAETLKNFIDVSTLQISSKLTTDEAINFISKTQNN